MPKLIVELRDGIERELNGEAGLSVMEVIREGGIDEILALCGGNCSCATCHVYIDAERASLLPPISGEEDDLLDGSEHRTERSRLSCQLICAPGLDGLRVEIAPED